MLAKNYKKRFNGQQCLKHRWIKNNNIEIKLDKEKCSKIMTRLKNFQSTSKLEQATWVYLVSFLTS